MKDKVETIKENKISKNKISKNKISKNNINKNISKKNKNNKNNKCKVVLKGITLIKPRPVQRYGLKDADYTLDGRATVYTSYRGKKKRKMINEMRDYFIGRPPEHYPKNIKLDVLVLIYRDKRYCSQMDVDNAAKIILDVVKSDKKSGFRGVYEDDCQIKRLFLEKFECKKERFLDETGFILCVRKYDPKKTFKIVKIKNTDRWLTDGRKKIKKINKINKKTKT